MQAVDSNGERRVTGTPSDRSLEYRFGDLMIISEESVGTYRVP